MKRKEIVATLMIEGFSEKTLVTLSDKELGILANRILGEQVMTTTTSPPPNPGNVTPVTNVSRNDVATQNALKQQKKPFSTYESEMGEGDDKRGMLVKRIQNKIARCQDEKKKGYLEDLLKKIGGEVKKEIGGVSLHEWVNGVVEKNVHPFTSKSDIMNMVNNKINEQEVMEPEKKKAIPPFLSYDEIKNMEADVEVAPAEPRTKPGTRPGTKPGVRPDKDSPYKPGPGKNPKPKALKHE